MCSDTIDDDPFAFLSRSGQQSYEHRFDDIPLIGGLASPTLGEAYPRSFSPSPARAGVSFGTADDEEAADERAIEQALESASATGPGVSAGSHGGTGPSSMRKRTRSAAKPPAAPIQTSAVATRTRNKAAQGQPSRPQTRSRAAAAGSSGSPLKKRNRKGRS